MREHGPVFFVCWVRIKCISGRVFKPFSSAQQQTCCFNMCLVTFNRCWIGTKTSFVFCIDQWHKNILCHNQCFDLGLNQKFYLILFINFSAYGTISALVLLLNLIYKMWNDPFSCNWFYRSIFFQKACLKLRQFKSKMLNKFI